MSIYYDAKTVSLIKIKLPGDNLWQPEQQLAQLELLLVGQAHAHLLLLTNPAEINMCIWNIPEVCQCILFLVNFHHSHFFSYWLTLYFKVIYRKIFFLYLFSSFCTFLFIPVRGVEDFAKFIYLFLLSIIF